MRVHGIALMSEPRSLIHSIAHRRKTLRMEPRIRRRLGARTERRCIALLNAIFINPKNELSHFPFAVFFILLLGLPTHCSVGQVLPCTISRCCPNPDQTNLTDTAEPATYASALFGLGRALLLREFMNGKTVSFLVRRNGIQMTAPLNMTAGDTRAQDRYNSWVYTLQVPTRFSV